MKPHPSSFRDPLGFMFEQDGVLMTGFNLHHLLTHSSGIPDTYVVDMSIPLAEWAPYLRYLSLNAEPGDFWNYANPNFSLAGLVVEKVSGVPYAEYMADHVWGPAGMTSATLDYTAVITRGNHATGFDPATRTEYPPQYWSYPALAPAGTAFATPSDMVRWASLLMAGGGGVLSPASIAAMQTRQMTTDQLPWLDYGYGIFVWDYVDATDAMQHLTVYEHGGNLPGWSAQLYWVPERRMAVTP